MAAQAPLAGNGFVMWDLTGIRCMKAQFNGQVTSCAAHRGFLCRFTGLNPLRLLIKTESREHKRAASQQVCFHTTF